MNQNGNNQQPEQPTACGLSRRDFLKMTAATGGAAAILGSMGGFARLLAQTEGADTIALHDPANQIYTVCLQCNTGCGIKVKLLDGVAAKIDGNPYSPWTLWPHLPYETPVSEMGGVEGGLCPKGQSGLQSAYDPYRIVSVLKRKPGTKRGEGQWETIAFDKAIEEVVNGGDLFGEGRVDGFKDLYALTDPDIAKQMADAIKKIWDEKDAAKKQDLVGEFKTTFADHLDVMIDPDHPDLGPKNNQFAFVWGRLKNGRGDLFKRFVGDSFGSINANGHTTVCQGSLYFTGKAMSEQFDPATGKFSGGSKFYWQTDTANSDFVIYVGANLFEANYGPPQRVPKMTTGNLNGKRYAVVDPRFSKAASKAWRWVPIKPGEDAALALAMIQWVVDNGRYNTPFIRNANKAAANAQGEATWTTGPWLVKIKDGKPGKFLRGSDLELTTTRTETDAEGKEITIYTDPDGVDYAFDPFVALADGEPVLFDPNSTEVPAYGDPFVDATLNGVAVKSGLQIIYEEATSRTIAEWAEIAGISEQDVVILAREFTSHGTRACADLHRGVSQHTNGFYNVMAWYTLNCLIGNADHAGGMIKGTSYDYTGAKAKGPFDLGKMINAKNGKLGIDILRTTTTYEKSTLFADYPAQRPWFPLATDLYQEDVASMDSMYPYQVKIAMFYMSAINYSLPAAHKVIETLADPNKIPLIITSDILVGETSTYADYIFPDLSFLERWELHGTHPSVPWKVENVRNPAISIPGWPTVTVYGEEIPMSAEAMMMAIAEKLDLPGFGPDGLGEGVPFTRPEHLYLKQVANIAFGEKEDASDNVPEADDEELRLFREARRHLPKSVYDEATWKEAVGNDDSLWRKVVYVMNRGGRYQAHAKAYKSDPTTGAMNVLVSNAYGKQLNLYQEKTATSINTMTGKPFAGYAVYLPPGLSSVGEKIEDAGYDLTLITHKEITMTKARTMSNYWLLAVLPENPVLMNASDAANLGLKDGDLVKIVSASNPDGVWDLQDGTQKPMVSKLKVTQGMRPGVVSFALGFGHWASGAREISINGTKIAGDERRGTGIHANAAMRVDPHLGNVTLQDLAGGSAVFYDTKVKVVKA
ncbi:MAG: molybdopterin-dependent oxidoreductase [Chloroflexi bacterium]|nr:molybdopterin-dependent oxidoreductase [Chloroflexota bacterium]